MKRFYDQVETVVEGRAIAVTLDGKPVRTPGRHGLGMPTMALADAVANEWQAQGDEIQPRDMPLTQFANTAIDRTRTHRPQVIEQVAAYGETDLLCYRASDPPDLVQIQIERWQPLLDWLEASYGSRLLTTTDIAPLAQPQPALLAIFQAVAACDDFVLTGLHATTAASGSVVIGLALACGHLDAEKAYELAQLDELFQIEKWGEDSDARERCEEIRDVLAAATLFMRLCQTPE